eukprot:8642364-Pyramimonas_sp.AAC.1
MELPSAKSGPSEQHRHLDAEQAYDCDALCYWGFGRAGLAKSIMDENRALDAHEGRAVFPTCVSHTAK